MAAIAPLHQLDIQLNNATQIFCFRTSDTYDGLEVETGVKLATVSAKDFPITPIKELIRARIIDRVMVEYLPAGQTKLKRLEMLVEKGKTGDGLITKTVKVKKYDGTTITGVIKHVIGRRTLTTR